MEHEHGVVDQVLTLDEVPLGESRWGLEQPSHVSVEEAALDGVRIIVGVSEAMMETMTHRPPVATPLERLKANDGEEHAERGS